MKSNCAIIKVKTKMRQVIMNKLKTADELMKVYYKHK